MSSKDSNSTLPIPSWSHFRQSRRTEKRKLLLDGVGGGGRGAKGARFQKGDIAKIKSVNYLTNDTIEETGRSPVKISPYPCFNVGPLYMPGSCGWVSLLHT